MFAVTPVYTPKELFDIISELPLLKTWNAKNVELDIFCILSTSLHSGKK